MTSAQYIINEGFTYCHKRRVVYRRLHVALFCSQESDGRDPKTHPLSWCFWQHHNTTWRDRLDIVWSGCHSGLSGSTFVLQSDPLVPTGTGAPSGPHSSQATPDSRIKSFLISWRRVHPLSQSYLLSHQQGAWSLKLTTLIFFQDAPTYLKLLASPFGRIHCAYLNNWTKPSWRLILNYVLYL